CVVCKDVSQIEDPSLVMKRSRISAIAVTAALAGSSLLLVASPATAATTIDDVTFYAESDFGIETGDDYPAGVDWFWGGVSGTEGPHAFTVGGLVLNEDLSGDVQILNQDVTTPDSAEDLLDILEEVVVYSTDAEWNFQLPFFAEPGDQFTTLHPSVLGGVSIDPNIYGLDLTNSWVTTGT